MKIIFTIDEWNSTIEKKQNKKKKNSTTLWHIIEINTKNIFKAFGNNNNNDNNVDACCW